MVKNQGTPAVATLHSIPINNILNLHYHWVFSSVLLKTNDITSVQNILHNLYTSSSFVETGVIRKKKILLLLYTRTMKKVYGSLRIGFANEDFWKKNDNTFPFICLVIVNIVGNESFTHTEIQKMRKS